MFLVENESYTYFQQNNAVPHVIIFSAGSAKHFQGMNTH
jgi:hypothetical protein